MHDQLVMMSRFAAVVPCLVALVGVVMMASACGGAVQTDEGGGEQATQTFPNPVPAPRFREDPAPPATPVAGGGTDPELPQTAWTTDVKPRSPDAGTTPETANDPGTAPTMPSTLGVASGYVR